MGSDSSEDLSCTEISSDPSSTSGCFAVSFGFDVLELLLGRVLLLVSVVGAGVVREVSGCNPMMRRYKFKVRLVMMKATMRKKPA